MSDLIPYLPIMLDCRDQKVLVVGGGKVAARKIAYLLEAQAHVTIISPEVTSAIQELAEQHKIYWLHKNYEVGDINSRFDREDVAATDTLDAPTEGQKDQALEQQRYMLVYAATSLPDVNAQVAQEAKQLGIPVNVADRHEKGTFINPSVIRRGRLIASVSTSGAGPALSRHIAQELEQYFDEEYELYMEFMYNLRHHIKRIVIDPQERKRLLEHAVALDVLAQIRHKQFVWWDEEQIEQWIIQYRGR